MVKKDMPYLHVLPGLALLVLLLVSCNTSQKLVTAQREVSPSPIQSSNLDSPRSSVAPVAYSEVFRITYASCLPCHNRNTLPQVIERVKAATFSTVDGETRKRVLAELEGLKALQDSGSDLGFSSGQKELMSLFKSMPGALFTMLDKGVMPPPWAPDLMEAIDWPNYERLSMEKRIKLLQFAKPYSEKYVK